MKKLATLLIAAGLVFGVSTGASAIDFKAKGQWIMSFDYGQNGNFTGGHGQTGYGRNGQDEFNAKQRVRLQLDAVASESLSGTLYFEIGDTTWGRNSDSGNKTYGQGAGGALGADGVSVEVRRAYIDWMVPETDLKVRMGIQGLSMPSYTMHKSQVFDDDVAAVALSYQFNEYVGATAFWARPYNDNYAGTYSSRTGKYSQTGFMDNVDAGGLIIPLTFDGVKITPFGMIAGVGPNADRYTDADTNAYFGSNDLGTSYSQFKSGMLPAWGITGSNGQTVNTKKLNEYATAWWAGVTGDITYWDPFRIAFDFNGGGVSYDNSRMNRAGWLATLLFEYKFDWGIPGLIGWYASGDDDDLGNGSERMPYLSVGNSDNEFSRFAFDGGNYIAREKAFGGSMTGTWGIGLRVKDFSFVEDLKHTFRINYIGGTNNHEILKKLHTATGSWERPNSGGIGVENMYLTDLDSALEIGLYNEYKMYDNFKVALDANYIAMFLDDGNKTWKHAAMNGKSRDVRDAWNVNVSFVYEF